MENEGILKLEEPKQETGNEMKQETGNEMKQETGNEMKQETGNEMNQQTNDIKTYDNEGEVEGGSIIGLGLEVQLDQLLREQLLV